ncbi:MAG: hypothetical protein IJ887_03495 [Prevotella sp.]|nr:hypothetical protein [Prevotella sp.]MBR6188076.1 hypothetical protein [Prevotella sp.]
MEWTENVIIADGDYVDSVAFNLTVNFERMIGRRIPPADMARWVECIALDGGMRPEGLQRSEALPTTQVVLVHGAGRKRMENFTPGNYADELHGKAFKGNLGEFVFTCINPEGFTTTDDLLADTLQLVLQADGVKRIMVVPSEQGLDGVRRVLRQTTDGDAPKCITVFAMQPIAGGRFSQEILGYSLMAALGVKGSELKPEPCN